mmetsp:Transcript_54637/g.111566  ORF Transcript_54637/g.111566 Transcript_54637/m.111566 type:complete len:211 (+) Transcript_54637:784-1416(+)
MGRHHTLLLDGVAHLAHPQPVVVVLCCCTLDPGGVRGKLSRREVHVAHRRRQRLRPADKDVAIEEGLVEAAGGGDAAGACVGRQLLQQANLIEVDVDAAKRIGFRRAHKSEHFHRPLRRRIAQHGKAFVAQLCLSAHVLPRGSCRRAGINVPSREIRLCQCEHAVSCFVALPCNLLEREAGISRNLDVGKRDRRCTIGHSRARSKVSGTF